VLKRIQMVVCLLPWLATAGIGGAEQASPPVSNVPELPTLLDNQFKGLEAALLPLAEEMPAEKYDFRPRQGEFKDVRTFGEQLRHVASLNLCMSAVLLGEVPPYPQAERLNGPPAVKSKEDVLVLLRRSFERAHLAIRSVNQGNLREVIRNPMSGEEMTRLGAASIMTWHSYDHYGQLVVYARMNGIVPPASRPRR
jgi:hypothetical protein